METLYYILKSLLYSTTCIIQSNHHTTVSQHARHKSKDPCRSCSVIQEGPKFNNRCALKGQERRRPHEVGNRDWSDATTSQGNQQPWEGRRGKEGSLPLNLRGWEVWPCQHLDLGHLASRLWETIFLLLSAIQFLVICECCPRECIHPSAHPAVCGGVLFILQAQLRGCIVCKGSPDQPR